MANDVIDIKEASAFLKISKGTLYAWVAKGIIPYYKPSGGKLFFRRSELEKWIDRSMVEADNGVE